VVASSARSPVATPAPAPVVAPAAAPVAAPAAAAPVRASAAPAATTARPSAQPPAQPWTASGQSGIERALSTHAGAWAFGFPLAGPASATRDRLLTFQVAGVLTAMVVIVAAVVTWVFP
jgi:hypothetical protein